jgi:hypothetical protein
LDIDPDRECDLDEDLLGGLLSSLISDNEDPEYAWIRTMPLNASAFSGTRSPGWTAAEQDNSWANLL